MTSIMTELVHIFVEGPAAQLNALLCVCYYCSVDKTYSICVFITCLTLMG